MLSRVLSRGVVEGCCPGCSGSCLPWCCPAVLSRVLRITFASGRCQGVLRVLSRVLCQKMGLCEGQGKQSGNRIQRFNFYLGSMLV